ncbi:MAG: PAS domain-containing protein [Thermoanaerobaculia bacterium]|nr:PAS domain-containing protein [Thermoanaerobaculia bacterium]
MTEREALLAAAVEASGAGIYYHSVPTGSELYFSERWAEILGYAVHELPSPSEFAGWLTQRIHPDDRHQCEAEYSEFLGGRLEDYRAEIRIRHKSDQWVFVEILSKARERGDGGRVKSVVGTMLDISERKAAEEALETIRKRLDLATSAARIGVWDWDVEADELIWDDSMYELYGLQEKGFSGAYEAWALSVHPDDLPTAEGAVQAALRGERGFDMEFRIVRPDQEVRVIKAVADVHFDSRGSARRMIGVNLDITELRSKTEELARSNAELEQFAYFASHDLQEPLRSVGGFVQLLQRRYRDQLDDTAIHYIERAVAGAERMRGLINDLLTYSRVRRRGRELELIACGAAVDEVVESLHGALHTSDGEVTRDELPEVYADPMQLRQLLQNLISNAVKFRRPDVPPRIHLGCRTKNGTHEFEVRDNGQGVPPDARGRIFELFQRLNARGEQPGSGIGLAICRRIVERHGGRIWVDSELGIGSTFRFTWPVKPR